MKNLVPCLFIIATAQSIDAQASTVSDTPFKVVIENIKTERNGQLIVFVFGEDGYPKIHEKALNRFIFTPDASTLTIEIKVPKNCHFALKVLHDQNKDSKVTKNWTGFLPKDGLGFSNRQRLRFGPPNYNRSKINHEQQPHKIVMQYF